MKFSHEILVYFPHESQENAKVNHPTEHTYNRFVLINPKSAGLLNEAEVQGGDFLKV